MRERHGQARGKEIRERLLRVLQPPHVLAGSREFEDEGIVTMEVAGVT